MIQQSQSERFVHAVSKLKGEENIIEDQLSSIKGKLFFLLIELSHRNYDEHESYLYTQQIKKYVAGHKKIVHELDPLYLQ